MSKEDGLGAPGKFTASFRFGYGLKPGEAPPNGPEALLAQIPTGAASQPKLSGPDMAERAALIREFGELRKRNRDEGGLREEMKAVDKRIGSLHRADIRRRTLAPVRSPLGFYERLAWFWADHFAVASNSRQQRVFTGRFEADAIRPHVGGRFRDLLRATSLHPAMLVFLNQNSSVGPNSVGANNGKRGLNENLAREIIELHTLGVGADYSQKDVRQFAELLTGLTFDRKTGEQVFRPRIAEPGAETVLGRTYGGGAPGMDDILQALDDLAAHPSTARHIGWKLARHFVADDPSDALVAHLANAFTRSDGWLPAVYEALLEHPEAWDSYGAKVRQPFDFVVASIRAIGPTKADFERLSSGEEKALNLVKTQRELGQLALHPPGPQGWPEEAEAWITPQGLTNRVRWASTLARHVEGRIDPRDFLSATLGPLAADETAFAATRAAERWEGIAFVLASPEFNRR